MSGRWYRLPSGPTCLPPTSPSPLPPSRDYNNVHLGLFISFQVLLAFVCLIVGFAFSFAVLFHGNDQFRNSWRAVVKTVVMMMGEYEYGALFSDEKNGSFFLPATSRVVFLGFVMLASIVLMNLMIGLAVNDIQGLEKEVRSSISIMKRILYIFVHLAGNPILVSEILVNLSASLPEWYLKFGQKLYEICSPPI